MAAHIVSGADEKIIRIFDPPFNFVKNINELSLTDYVYTNEMSNQDVAKRLKEKL